MEKAIRRNHEYIIHELLENRLDNQDLYSWDHKHKYPKSQWKEL
jgi:hypothetical protein